MEYAATPAEPKVRPAVVTAASWLLYLYAALSVVGAALNLVQLGPMRAVYRRILTDVPGAETMETFMTVGVGFGAAMGLLFAAGFVVLGILDSKGKNVARIITWVVAGISICCGVGGLAGSAVNFGGGGGAPGQPSPQEIQRALEEALPGWFYPTTIAFTVVGVVALVAVIILLALPAANEFFRKPPQQPAWEPPVPPTA